MLEKDLWNQNLDAWDSAYLTDSPRGSEASQSPTTAVTGPRTPGEQGHLFIHCCDPNAQNRGDLAQKIFVE